jgi:uncharacterized protein (DUF1697 family)
MDFVALLRGVNVGASIRVDMARLRSMCASLGLERVRTYINSGNLLFSSDRDREALAQELRAAVSREFGAEVPVLVKTGEEMARIAAALPGDWEHGPQRRTDVAYLFAPVDFPGLAEDLPLKREYVDLRYIPGALLWNVARADLGRCGLSRIVGHRAYPFMTVRNANTARFLGRGG